MGKSLVFITAFLCCLLGYQVEGQCGKFYLTVQAKTRKVVVNWDYINNEVLPDKINIFYLDNEGARLNLQNIAVKGKIQGSSVSKLDFERKFPGNWGENDTNPIEGSHCFPYHAECLINGQVIASTCLKTEPSWMKSFGDLQVSKMMIPGTHDSGAYDGFGVGLIKRYALAQEFNLYEQLVSGIRYLDIRVGIYRDLKPKAWINHGQVRCTELEKELRRVATFLRKSPTEVVILHFHQFPMPFEFSRDDHQLVLDMLQDVFGDLILERRDVVPTISEQQASNKRLIISYAEDGIVGRANELLEEYTPRPSDSWCFQATHFCYEINLAITINNLAINKLASHVFIRQACIGAFVATLIQTNFGIDWLWYAIPHKWGNKRNADDLRAFILKELKNHNFPRTPFDALISVLTPDDDYILTHLTGSLRDMADLVNPHIAQWIRREHWGPEIRIYATDFFIGNDVIDVSIEANKEKLLGAH